MLVNHSISGQNQAVDVMIAGPHKPTLWELVIALTSTISSVCLDDASIGRRCAPRTSRLQFYAWKLARLLEFEPLATSPFDAIKGEMIENYVRYRRQHVSPTRVNRELATLRRALRVAQALARFSHQVL